MKTLVISSFDINEILSSNCSLNHNELTEIKVFPILSIKILNLHHNKISKIEKGAFYNLTLLEELDLSANDLTTKALMPEIFTGHFNPSLLQPLEHLKVSKMFSLV